MRHIHADISTCNIQEIQKTLQLTVEGDDDRRSVCKIYIGSDIIKMEEQTTLSETFIDSDFGL